jgi:hypothetical protein
VSYQLPHWVWPSVLMTACAVAVWRGRDDERLAAGALLADWALSMVVFKSQSEETQWGMLLVDFAQFLVLVWIGLRSARYWPLFVGGFALLQLLTHVAHALDAGVSGWAYITAELIWSYLMVFTVAYGAWTAPRYAPTADAPRTVPGDTRR